MKNAVFWDVAAFFTVTAVKTSDLTMTVSVSVAAKTCKSDAVVS
jgi:hypothetical protein